MSYKYIIKYGTNEIASGFVGSTDILKTLPTQNKLLNNNISFEIVGYGEEALIPTMTSNTTPYGTASCSQNQSDGPAWHAFESNSDCWFFQMATGAWIKYQFVDNVTISKVIFKNCVSNFDRCYISNISITVGNTSAGSFNVNTGSEASTTIELTTPLTGNSITITANSFSSSNSYSGITQIQAYGY